MIILYSWKGKTGVAFFCMKVKKAEPLKQNPIKK
jgi:hypothetical protein